MTKKILVIFLSIIVVFTLFSTTSQSIDLKKIIDSGKNFTEVDTQENEVINQESLQGTVDVVYNTLLVIGTVIAVLIASVLGIKFIIGSVEEKVKIKESLLPFVIGTFVLYAAFGIWRLVIILIR